MLLTDGVQTGTPGAELAAAERVRAAGVRLYTVGLGADADGPTLVAMAGESGRYYHAPGAAELEGVYRAIARDVACPAEGLWGHGGQGGGDRRRAAAR